MESSTSYTAIKDGFEVILNKSDSELAIKAEDKENENTFASQFSNEEIPSMTRDLFGSIPELYEGLLTAFDALSEETSVKVSQKGKLMFTQKVNIGKYEKIFDFAIPLKLVENDPVNRLEKLEREVEMLKRENQQFQKEIKHLKENNNVYTDYEVISPCFDVFGTYKENFELSQDQKKVTLRTWDQMYYHPMGSSQMMSKEKNSKFSAKIDGSGRGFVAVGLGTQNLQTDKVLFPDGAYCLGLESRIHDGGEKKTYTNYSSVVKDSTIGVLYIPSKGRILFDIDGIHVYTARVAEEHQEAGLYPFATMTYHNSTACFL